jgi:hypothetical protein
MAKTTHRLTAVTVANLKTKGLYAEGDGLYLRITGQNSRPTRSRADQLWVYGRLHLRQGLVVDSAFTVPPTLLARAAEVMEQAPSVPAR